MAEPFSIIPSEPWWFMSEAGREQERLRREYNAAILGEAVEARKRAVEERGAVSEALKSGTLFSTTREVSPERRETVESPTEPPVVTRRPAAPDAFSAELARRGVGEFAAPAAAAGATVESPTFESVTPAVTQEVPRSTLGVIQELGRRGATPLATALLEKVLAAQGTAEAQVKAAGAKKAGQEIVTVGSVPLLVTRDETGTITSATVAPAEREVAKALRARELAKPTEPSKEVGDILRRMRDPETGEPLDPRTAPPEAHVAAGFIADQQKMRDKISAADWIVGVAQGTIVSPNVTPAAARKIITEQDARERTNAFLRSAGAALVPLLPAESTMGLVPRVAPRGEPGAAPSPARPGETIGQATERQQVEARMRAQQAMKVDPARALVVTLGQEVLSLVPEDPASFTRTRGYFSDIGKRWGQRVDRATAEVRTTNPRLTSLGATLDGVLALFVRAFGDVGTLNEGDIRRARALMPIIFPQFSPVPPFLTHVDSRAEMVEKLTRLTALFDEIASRTPTPHAPGAIRTEADLNRVLGKMGGAPNLGQAGIPVQGGMPILPGTAPQPGDIILGPGR